MFTFIIFFNFNVLNMHKINANFNLEICAYNISYNKVIQINVFFYNLITAKVKTLKSYIIVALHRYLSSNAISFLPDGVFANLTHLLWL